MWTDFRNQFPIFEKVTYLNTCSLGALSLQGRQAVDNFLQLWQEMGASAWYELWLGEIEKLRECVASLLGCGIHEVALIPNVSAGLSAVASSLDYGDRNRVVCSALDFPTVPYQWHARARDGVEVVLAESPDGMGIPETVYDSLLNERTALLAVGHVFFTTGWVHDLKVLAEKAHSVGAYLIVDAYQSAGILPLQVHDLGVDILLTGGLKWLLGGPGIAFMYVREDLHEMLDPRSTGWFAVADQFSFDPAKRTLRKDARRLEGGTPAPAAVYAARAGLDLVLEKGVGLLGARTLELVHYLALKAEELNIEIRIPRKPHRRSGIVIVPDENPHSTVAALMEEGIIVDARPSGVRVSPYAYNNEEDIDKFLGALAGLRSA